MKRIMFWISCVVCFLPAISGCGVLGDELASGEETLAPTTEAGGAGVAQDMSFTIISPAFAPDKPIPVKYTCDGEDISPPLRWDTPPGGTQSLALIMDDPDAPMDTWIHWVVFNLPPAVPGLSENATTLPEGSGVGQNSWGRLGYGGPCPPSETHRYFFKLYALDMRLDVPDGASKDQVLALMEGHILAQAELMGTYTKQ